MLALAGAGAAQATQGDRHVSLLEVAGLSKRFGGLCAVNDVGFHVGAGAIKAVIGPNGAGKTTLFNLIFGSILPDQGTVSFAGQILATGGPRRRVGLGMARTFQHIRLFPQMTALENVMVGAHTRGRVGFLASLLHLPRTWREERFLREQALSAMAFLGIESLAGSDATQLAYGEQRAVELARALAAKPRLLLLDEPAAGLNMRETVELGKLIRRIRDTGVTVLLVEHDMGLVMGISDEIVVLCQGQKIAEGKPLAVQKNAEVIRAYLGDDDG
jgi:branched-chain amino acid transport system ATP-binding protein